VFARPSCYPAPIGDGTRPYIAFSGFNSPAAMAWFCGRAGKCIADSPPFARLGNLLSVFDKGSADAAWDNAQWRELSPAEDVLCKALWSANRPALPVWVISSVAVGSDRPVYACNATCLSSRNRGSSVGRSGLELVATCEGPLTPPWLSGTSGAQWQFTTATNGARGVAVCELKR
jgi:hypothetical protein